MSVVGIDFGNLSLLIGQTSKGGVDVILNDASNRQTATAVSVQGKQRFIGDAGAAMAKSNLKNTITCMKLLVGRQFDDEDVQKEISKMNFKAVKLSNGGVGVEIQYNDEPLVVSVEHVMGMMLTKAKAISAGANQGANIADAVLAVPAYYTEAQRRGVLQAAEIAELNCLKVANESTMIGLSYGIFKSAKKLFSETESLYVMFIDIGYTCYTVSIVDFIQENMKVLASICDPGLGGRDFDNVIIEYLAASFEKKTKINVRNNRKAVLKLQAAAEKAKKTLSPAGVSEAAISVECLAEDMDHSCSLKKDEFEERCADIIARLEEPINEALAVAGLSKDQISETELLGGSSRINIVKKTLGSIMGLDAGALNYGLKTTMNADEAVARGSALQCAMVSSRMKVKPFNIVDKLSYGVAARFIDEEDPSKETTVGLYTKGDEIPHKPRRLTFQNKSTDFTITLEYDEDAAKNFLPKGESRFLGKYTIKVSPSDSPSHVRVTWNLDRNGMVALQSAELMEELPPKDDAKEDGKNTEEKNADEGKEEGKEAPAPPKKRYKKTELAVETMLPGLTKEDMKAALELEKNMFYEDKLIVETADKRNELESFIYSMRDRIVGVLKTYATKDEAEELQKKMMTTEDWLYSDEGFDTTKQEYTRQLEQLTSISNKPEFRLAETTARPPAIEQLKKQIEMCKTFASRYDEATEHIKEEDRGVIRKEVQAMENWMYDSIGKQGDVPSNQDPVLTSAMIQTKRNALFNVCNPIMTKTKPAPPAPAPKAEEKPAPADTGSKGESGGDKGEKGQAPAADEKGEPMSEVNEPDADAMDQEKK